MPTKRNLRRRRKFDQLVKDGYLPKADFAPLTRSDNDVRVGMSRHSDLVSRDGLKFLAPMSRRELYRLSK